MPASPFIKDKTNKEVFDIAPKEYSIITVKITSIKVNIE